MHRASGALPPPGPGIRQALGAPPLAELEVGQLLAAFPAQVEAARPWAEGLQRLQRFDPPGAAARLAEADGRERHYRIAATLASAQRALGHTAAAQAAIAAALGQARGLPAVQVTELELLDAKIRQDGPAILASSRALFRTHFPDDLLRGLAYAGELQELGKNDELLLLLGELRQLEAAAGHPGFFLLESKANYRRGDPAAAAAAAQRSLDLATGLGAVRRQAIAKLALAVIATDRAEKSAAAIYLRQAKEIFERIGDRQNQAACLELAGRLAEKDDLGLADQSFREAIELYRAVGAQLDLGRASFGLAGVLMARGDGQGALAAVAAAKELAGPSWSGLERAQYLAATGYYEHLAGRLEEAREDDGQAAAIFSRLDAQDDYGAMLANQGEIEYALGRLGAAAEYLELALAQHAEAPSSRAFDLAGLGRIAAAKGDLPAAREKFAAGLRLQQSLGEDIYAAETRIAMAELELAAGELATGTALAAEAEKILRQADEKELAARATALACLGLLAQGRAAEAQQAFAPVRGLVLVDFRSRYAVRIVAARLDAAAGRGAAALAALSGLAGEAAAAHHLLHELEILLELGRLERSRATRGRAASDSRRSPGGPASWASGSSRSAPAPPFSRPAPAPG